MTVDQLVRTISGILAPAVMVTCCAIFLNGLFGRYEAISARMRAMHRERLDLLDALRPVEPDEAQIQSREVRRTREIERQLPDLLQRHRLLRDAVLMVTLALLIFVVTMILIAVAVVTRVPAVTTTTLASFLAGTAAFLVGAAITAFELSRSHREVAYEIRDGLAIR